MIRTVVIGTPAETRSGWWELALLNRSGDRRGVEDQTLRLPTFMLNPAVRFRGTEVELVPAGKPGRGFWRVRS